jgi:hypothetical protein
MGHRTISQNVTLASSACAAGWLTAGLVFCDTAVAARLLVWAAMRTTRHRSAGGLGDEGKGRGAGAGDVRCLKGNGSIRGGWSITLGRGQRIRRCGGWRS